MKKNVSHKKKAFKKCVISLFIFILSMIHFEANAQSDSLKYFRNEFSTCDELAKKGKYDKAIECYETLLNSNKKNIKILIRLAELSYVKRDKNSVIKYVNKAISIDANQAYSPATYLANKMMSNKDEDIGLQILNMLTKSDLDTVKQEKAERNKMHYTLKSYADKTPVAGVNLMNMGDSINTKENEYLPSISLDGSKMVFTRNVGGNEDFFISTKDTNQIWSKAQNLGYPPNTGLPDGAAKLSADGNYLFYTRCDMRSPDGIRGGGCDLVFSYKTKEGWSAPQYFGFTINTTAYEGQPCLSSDNKELYFVSNREGGYGGMDIWVTKFENRLWQPPTNLGPTVNTDKDETSPFIHPDNETLYFASNGHTSIGSSDLFISRKNINNTWRTPINLGAPINTEKFDGSIVVNAKGTIGYCTSDRSDTKGGLDIYSFEMYPAIQPIPTLCMKGFLIDKYYKNHIYKKQIDFINSFNNLSVGEEISNAGDGSYTKALQMGKTYTIVCNVNGYRPFYKKISLTNDSLPDNYFINIKLKQPGIIDTLFQTELTLDTTHTFFDSLSLVRLDSVQKTWDYWNEDTASVVIFLKSYYYAGDSIGDTTFKENIDQCFSQMNMIKTYLSKKKIPCEIIMQDPCMLIFKDDELPYRKIEMRIVEYY